MLRTQYQVEEKQGIFHTKRVIKHETNNGHIYSPLLISYGHHWFVMTVGRHELVGASLVAQLVIFEKNIGLCNDLMPILSLNLPFVSTYLIKTFFLLSVKSSQGGALHYLYFSRIDRFNTRDKILY